MKKFLLFLPFLLPYFSFAQFVAPKPLFQADYAQDVLTFDCNGDHLDEIIVRSYANYFIIHKNLGNGAFKVPGDTIKVTESYGITEIVDIDKDNDLDILCMGYQKIVLLKNTGGVFTEQVIVSNAPDFINSVSPGDFDNDGDIDLFVCGFYNRYNLYYIENTGNNIFSNPVVWLGDRPDIRYLIKTVDFNGDGLLDMVSNDFQKFKIYVNKGNFQFDTLLISEDSPADSNQVQMHDIDLDGDNDFIKFSHNNVFVYEQLEGLKFSEAKPMLTTPAFIRNGFLFDKDADGDQDIIMVGYDYLLNGEKISYMENLGDGLFSSPIVITSSQSYYYYTNVSDVNADNFKDILYLFDNIIYCIENTDRKMNTISGNIYYDKNDNCSLDGNDEPVMGVIVKAGTSLCITDQNGKYNIMVDVGTYAVDAVFNISSDKLISYCNSTQQLDITQPGSVITDVNFGAKVKLCPELNVSINSDRRRRCFTSPTTVTYTNTGTSTAVGVKIKVVYPKYVKLVSSTPEFTTSSDSLFVFEIGDLVPGETGSIRIIDSVVCGIEEIRGLTQCTKAYISTTTSCITDVVSDDWDKSSISVTGSCNKSGDRVIFSIKNGDDSGDMADSSEYRVYYNDTLVYTDKFKLESGESLPVSVPAYGQTVRLEADQHPLHPGKSRPREIIEACGSSLEKAKKGFVLSVPQDDIAQDVDISCMEIIDSYDPNDKLAEPAGFTSSNFIFPGERIEYTIRFQNTGSDTAYKIVVVDTLLARYDISSLEILSASHPYKVTVTGSEKPVIRWVFNNIMLPDSFVNEPASNGYVKFAIRSEAQLEEGVSLENFADIFFDYNSAIRTNTYVHEINYFIPEDKTKGLGITKTDGVTGITNKLLSSGITVYPNPFSEKVTFNVSSNSPYNLQLFSSTGVEVKAIYNITSQKVELNKGELKAGIYMYTISSEKDGMIANGKIVAADY